MNVAIVCVFWSLMSVIDFFWRENMENDLVVDRCTFAQV